MLDKKTLDRWLEIRNEAVNGGRDLNIAGSQARDKSTDLSILLYCAAQLLEHSAQVMEKAIRLAAEEGP